MFYAMLKLGKGVCWGAIFASCSWPPLGEQWLALLEAEPKLFSSVAHRKSSSWSSFAVKQSMSVHIALYQLEIWSSVLTDAGGSCCGVFVNLVGLKGHVVRKLLHSYSFSTFFSPQQL